MIPRSAIQIRRRFTAMVAVLAGLTVFVLSYCLFLFLHFEHSPQAQKIVDTVLDRLTEGQVFSHLGLSLKVDPGTSLVEGQARITFDLPQRGAHLVLPHVLHGLLFIHPDLVFQLNPDFVIDRIVWGDRKLVFRRVKSMVFVDLDAAVPEDGLVVLDVNYRGRLYRKEGASILAPTLIYLDPKDMYYPSQAGARIYLDLNLDLPEGLTPVIPSLEQPLSSFALAGVPSTPEDKKYGSLDVSLAGWGERTDWIAGWLDSICEFLETRYASPAVHQYRVLRCPPGIEHSVRYDDTGTILVPGGISLEDLTFFVARCWLHSPQAGEKALFSREEMARSLALYFVERRQGEAEYAAGLLSLSENPTPSVFRNQAGFMGEDYRDGNLYSSQPGAYPLCIFRRLVGDAAFDRILQMMLLQMDKQVYSGWEGWNELVRRFTGEELRWLFRGWAHGRRQVDLAVEDLKVEEHDLGQKISVTLRNRGDLDLPEKVKTLFITQKGAVHELLSIPQEKKEYVRFIHDRILGVVVDPEADWYDRDRNNNLAYLDPPPVLVIPSEENNSLAVAYPKRAGADHYPLAIFEPRGALKAVYSLLHPVEKMEWISEWRLLISTRCMEDRSGLAGNVGAHYLIDTLNGEVTYFEPGIDLQASDSGQYLLLNIWQDERWLHKLKNLDNKLTRGLLSGLSKSVPYRLHWLPGTDSIIPAYPYDYQGRYAIYSLDGKEKNYFLVHDERIYGMHGFGEGLVFLREKEGEMGFFTKNASDRVARMKAQLAGEPMGFKASRYGGTLFWRERLPDDRFHVLRYDQTRERIEVLFEGPAKSIYDIFCDKGILAQADRIDRTGTKCKDILFHRFGETEGEFITDSPAPERILALVGNQRYLYYAEEIQVPWSPLSVYNLRRFYCYDFLNRENRLLDFSAWSP